MISTHAERRMTCVDVDKRCVLYIVHIVQTRKSLESFVNLCSLRLSTTVLVVSYC
jgi:hypothetical protein